MWNELSAQTVTRLKRSWGKRSFDRVAEGVLDTPPLRPQGNSPLYLSMLCHRDVTAYLLALKSLYAGIGYGRAAIIDDGSLTSADLAILEHHIPGIEVFDINAIGTGSSPHAGCWERLVKIIDLAGSHYVIQLDADTLVCGAIPEVVQCWRDNRSFLLGTGSGQAVAPAADAARMVQGWIETHGWTDIPVGTAAEAALDQLPGAGERFYVHASAGFAGFARSAFRMADLEWFSTVMSEVLGAKRWNEWGSEQIASNYILANAPGATVLPYPRYACFEPHLKRGEHAFLHFIGTYRYDDGVYRRRAAQFIARYNRLSHLGLMSARDS